MYVFEEIQFLISYITLDVKMPSRKELRVNMLLKLLLKEIKTEIKVNHILTTKSEDEIYNISHNFISVTDKSFSKTFLGRGCFGVCYLNQDKDLVCKEYRTYDFGVMESFAAEVFTLNSLRHVEGFQRLAAVYLNVEEKEFKLYTNYTGITVREFFKNIKDYKEIITDEYMCKIIIKFLNSVCYLLENDIYHSDMSFNNMTIMNLDSDVTHVKCSIIDFGCSNIKLQSNEKISNESEWHLITKFKDSAKTKSDFCRFVLDLYTMLICSQIEYQTITRLMNSIDNKSGGKFISFLYDFLYKDSSKTPKQLYKLLTEIAF